MDSTPSEPWNTYRKVNINHMSYNQDFSLFVLATSRGYRVFDAKSFVSVCKVDDYHEVIGDLSLASTLFKSQLIYFVGNEDNITYTQSQLVIWDDIRKTKIGMLFLKDSIINFYLTKNLLLILSGNKILIFENLSLKFITKFENLNMNEKLFSVSQNEIIAYNTIKKKNCVYVKQFFFDKFKINGIRTNEIDTGFKDIQAISLSKKGTQLVVASVFGNKLHIYDIDGECNLRLCLFTGNQIVSVDNLCFSPKKEKYICYISESRKIQIFPIKNNFENNFKCFCDQHNDEELLGKKTKTENSKSFFGLFGNVIYT